MIFFSMWETCIARFVNFSETRQIEDSLVFRCVVAVHERPASSCLFNQTRSRFPQFVVKGGSDVVLKDICNKQGMFIPLYSYLRWH